MSLEIIRVEEWSYTKLFIQGKRNHEDGVSLDRSGGIDPCINNRPNGAHASGGWMERIGHPQYTVFKVEVYL